MSYTTITARCSDQALVVTSVPKLASGGEKEIRVEVIFDELWAGYGKTMIFYRDKKQVYHVVMADDVCVIPREVMTNPGTLYMGVIGVSGASVRTSEVVALSVVQGAITGLAPFEPLPDVYKQVLSAEGANARAIKVERKRIDNLIANGGATDDAELLDLRVGAEGETYESAGAAVRTQIEAKAAKRDVEQLREVVSYDYQYLNRDTRTAGEYWSLGPGNTVTNYETSGYARYPAVMGLPAGTYYWNYLSLNFTYIEIIGTGELLKLSALTSGATTIDIAHPFNLYATVSGADTAGLFGSGDLPDDYILGVYNVKYKEDAPHVFYCGPTREYTKLTEAIAAAEEYMDAILYVDRATYDLIEEYGSDYFANYTTADGYGIVLKNRIHIIFEQGAKVVCNYTGENANVHTHFSPFNAGSYGFTLENAWVESTNTRYTMHDGLSGTSTPNRNVYKRCTFIHDSTATSWGAHQALGGGLGSWGDILIEDCYMAAVGCVDVLTYHNAGYNNPDLTDYASRIVIRGCYLEGTIRINATGYTTRVTEAYVSGNSVTVAPRSGKTTTDAADNVKLYAWNNTIRAYER